MAKSSFSSMFSRLPTYSRFKEPAIGAPVLTQSTNERLSGRRGLTIVGLDGRPRSPDSLRAVSSYNLDRDSVAEKGLPQIPSTGSFVDEFQKPANVSATAIPRKSNIARKPAPKPDQKHAPKPDQRRAPKPDQRRAPKPDQKHGPNPDQRYAPNPDQRQTPSPDQTSAPKRVQKIEPWDSMGSSTTTITAGNVQPRQPNHERSASSGILFSNSSGKGCNGGFALGHLVKDRVTGRRRQQHQPFLTHPDTGSRFDIETSIVRPAGLNSIDDWLDSREDLHKRSTVIRRDVSEEDLKLHIRQSTFAPLQAPVEFSMSSPKVDAMPLIPTRYATPATPASAPARLAAPPAPARQSSLPQNERSPQTRKPVCAQSSVPSSPEPKDRMAELEAEQENLETRKLKLRKGIYDFEQKLLGCSNRAVRDQLEARIREMNRDYADLEKTAHDLGLKLYRAYRRMDKRDGGDGPTHLWVSRVMTPLDADV